MYTLQNDIFLRHIYFYLFVCLFVYPSKHLVRASRGDLTFLVASEPLPSKAYVLVRTYGADLLGLYPVLQSRG